MRDLISSGVFERHRRLTLAIVGFELGVGAPPARHDGSTYRERALPIQEPAPEVGNGIRRSDFFRRSRWVLLPGRTQRPPASADERKGQEPS